MAESGCKCKRLSIHRPDTSGYLMYHTSNLCIIHQILCIGTISSDTSCIIHQILDVYLHLHPDERLAPNFAIRGAIHILYSDTAYTAIHGDTAYRMYHPPSAKHLEYLSGSKVDTSYARASPVKLRQRTATRTPVGSQSVHSRVATRTPQANRHAPSAAAHWAAPGPPRMSLWLQVARGWRPEACSKQC